MNLTDDVEYTLSVPGIVTIAAEGDEAGLIRSLGPYGAVMIRATDPSRGLTTRPRRSLWVLVAGSLTKLDVTPSPLTLAVGDERRATVVGRLDSGLTTHSDVIGYNRVRGKPFRIQEIVDEAVRLMDERG